LGRPDAAAGGFATFSFGWRAKALIGDGDVRVHHFNRATKMIPNNFGNCQLFETSGEKNAYRND
jgi:hypothetical protein